MINDETAARLAKLQELRRAGIDPYPAKAGRSHQIAALLNNFENYQQSGREVEIAGRIRLVRAHGGLTFVHLEDGSGRLQAALRKDGLGAAGYELFGRLADLGDIVSFRGRAFTTKVGEKSLDVLSWTMLTKTLLPLPEKWHGLSDTETRFRQRYLDLIANAEVRALFQIRGRVLSALRDFLDQRGFLEVETPVLQTVPGGANARPFRTHHHALNLDLFLRIAPELHLKRLIVGGYERVYEFARCFRNEGIDHLHYPEFTQVELYQAYANYEDLMSMIEELLPALSRAAGVDPAAVPYEGETISLLGPYPRISFRQALRQQAKIDLEDFPRREQLAKKAASLGVPVIEADSQGTILDGLFKKFVRPAILEPTFIIDHPLELSPLAKRKADDPAYVERFQLLLGRGTELVNAFSELNDPLDQEERFRSQEAARRAGDEEAQRTDEDFLTALRHGLPPTAGAGLGIERLMMLLTGSHSIKEVILFPTLRPTEEPPS